MIRKSTIWTKMSVALLISSFGLWSGCQNTPEKQDSNTSAMVMEEKTAPKMASTTSEPQATTETPAKPTMPAPPAPKPVAKEPVVASKTDEASIGELQIDRTRHDWGKVEPGSSNTTQFTLTNIGKGVLNIERTNSSCGCTVPALKKKVLQPGESVEMTVNYKAKSHPGKASTWVEIYTKAPAKPSRQRIQMSSEVVQHLTVTPDRLKFELRDSAEAPQLVIKSNEDTPFRVLSLASTGQVATAQFDPDARATEHKITLTLDREKLRQYSRGNITITVDHPHTNKVSVYYFAELPFAAKPTTSSIRQAKPGESRRSSVTIVSNYGEEFELGDISSQDGHISVVGQEKTEDGYRIDFDFNVPADKTSGYVTDHLIVSIKDHPEDQIDVRCYAMIAPQQVSKTTTPAGQ